MLNVDEDAEKLDHPYTAGENVKRCCHSGKRFGSFFENYTCNYHTTQQPTYWGFVSEKWNSRSHKNLYTQMLTAALPVTAKNWNQPRFPSIRKWVNKLWPIHTMKYHLAIKRNKLPIPTTTRINDQGITLSEKSQFQMVIYCMISST